MTTKKKVEKKRALAELTVSWITHTKAVLELCAVRWQSVHDSSQIFP